MSQSEELAKSLQTALGPNLKSVILYGSKVAGDFLPGVSGRDILIVTAALGEAEISALAAPLAVWTKKGNPLPHIFTAEELAHSADAFPIEISDMQQSRQVLCGSDPLADMKIDVGHYRLQLERELKSRLHLLRREFLTVLGSEERVGRLLVASLSTFLVLLRATLRLYNDSAPAEKLEALDELTKHIAFDPQPLRQILELKASAPQASADSMTSLFYRYLNAIEKVVSAVDRLLHSQP